MRDPYTEAHSQRMADYAVATARALRVPIEEVENIRYAAILHDIGKIGISDRILRKPGPLTSAEYRVIQQHSRIGAEILEEVEALKDISEVLYHHHERYDGAGYPDGLAAEKIPVGARIIGVIDAYDAMTSQRPYRLALGHEKAVEELRRGAHSQFDPRVVEAFVRAVERDRRLSPKTA
jgi:putative nucleotidyltransferase with HDIG domain